MLRRNLGPILWTSAFTILLGLAAAPARADDMFLQLGDIQGESTARGYEKWIDVVSWSWGVTNPTTVGAGTGLSAGKATMSDLTLMKFADSATPRLFDAACKGTHFPAATLAVRRSSDGLEYLKIRLEEIFVTSVQLSTGASDPQRASVWPSRGSSSTTSPRSGSPASLTDGTSPGSRPSVCLRRPESGLPRVATFALWTFVRFGHNPPRG